MKKRPANEQLPTPLELAWWCVRHRILGATLCDPVAYEVLYPACLMLAIWPLGCLESPEMQARFAPRHKWVDVEWMPRASGGHP